MASTLKEYYTGQGQALPTVADRAPVAAKAGISNYVGSAEQNNALLGYLQSTPNTGTNVITADNLQSEKPVVVPTPKVDTAPSAMNSTITALTDTTKKAVEADQATYDQQTADLAAAVKASGDTGATTEAAYKANNVDTLLTSKNKFTSDIEAEQKRANDAIETLRTSPEGLTGGVQAQIQKIQRDSANTLANLGIGLSAVSRDYESAYNIAQRTITANSDKMKADIESRQFVLSQLGTKLATEKANAFTLQVKAIDNETSMLNDAVKVATDGMKDLSIDLGVGSKAIQDLISGKISLSQYYAKLGQDPSTTPDTSGSNIAGTDITTYATDPTHEQKVLSIYNTIGNISSASDATAAIKSMSPNSPITGQMIADAADKYSLNSDQQKLMISIMQQDSSLGTAGLGKKTKNPGNVGNDDNGNIKTYNTWNEGVNAVAKWIKGHPADTTNATAEKDYNKVGLLANTSFNPKSEIDKNAGNYLDAYLNSKNGALPTAASLFGSSRGNFAAKFTQAQDRAKQLFYEATGQSLPDLSTLTANKNLINANNKILNNNAIASETVAKNFDLAINGEITNNVNKNATIVNKILNPIYLALGDPAVNQALVSNGTISQEFANLVSIRNAQGTTVSDKEMASELIRFGTSVDAQKAVVERLKAEAVNIHSALLEQNSELYKVTDPLQKNQNNPNRKMVATSEPQAEKILTDFTAAHPEKATEIYQRTQSGARALGREMTAMEFLQAYPEYATSVIAQAPQLPAEVISKPAIVTPKNFYNR